MCELCERFDFGSASYEIDRHGTRIVLAGGSYRFPPKRQFEFCPRCGASRVEVLAKRPNNWQDSPIRHFIADN